METKTETKTNPFGDWIAQIPAGDYHEVRKSIVARCKISRATFSNWRRGYYSVPPLAQDVINAIAIEFNQPIVFRS